MEQVTIRQGDIFWADLGAPIGSAPGFRRPVVVVQNNRANRTGLRTVIVCAVSSNARLRAMPGNVALQRGDAGLPEASVVVVSQLVTVDRDQLEEWIGVLSTTRLQEVLSGIDLFLQPTP